jgi:hypothetical protein
VNTAKGFTVIPLLRRAFLEADAFTLIRILLAEMTFP